MKTKPAHQSKQISCSSQVSSKTTSRLNHAKKIACRSLALSGLLAFVSPASAAIIFATGQNNGDSSHTSGNYYYSIDTATGVATAISPLLPGSSPAGLSAIGNQLVGFKNGQHGAVDPVAGTFAPAGASNGFSITGYEVFNGFGYGVPTSGSDRRLQQIDLLSSTATPLGEGNPIGAVMDSFYGEAPGTNNPFIISMGSVGDTLYGIHIGGSKNNLLSLDPSNGSATVIGGVNAVGTSGNPGEGRFSGFSALTGVDEDSDGMYDTLYGNVNFFDPDAGGPESSQRLGGVARYDLSNGTWEMVGTNPGLIFFGFGSSPASRSTVPEPPAGFAILLLTGAAMEFFRRRTTRPLAPRE